MTIQDYNKAIILLIHYIVINNAYGVAQALKNENYDAKKYIPEGELETALLQLYIANKQKFFKVMKNISWNNGHVATNQPKIKDKLIQLTSIQAGTPVTGDWWQTLITSLSSYTPVYAK